MKPIPVILDTDIGGDIDDTWALAFLLRCPELDLKLVSTNCGDTVYRARLAAKLLQVAGRPEIPVAAGLGDGKPAAWDMQRPWVEGFELPGLSRDAPQAIVETVLASPEPVTLIAIGTAANIAAALQLEPRIAARCRLAGMYGSIGAGLLGAAGAVAEHNVVQDIPAAQALFAAPWLEGRVTPLDSCGRVMLKGEDYALVRDSADPLCRAILENYRLWSSGGGGGDVSRASSSLYDTVAVYLAFADALLEMKSLGIRVDAQGYTRPDPAARAWNVALAWKGLPEFHRLLVERLAGSARP